MRKLQLVLTLAIGIAISMAVPVIANGAPTVLFDTFGPEDTYYYSGGWTVGWIGVDTACQFAIAAATPQYLDKIELAASMVGGTNQLDVWLMSDAEGEPGTIIEAFNFDGEMGWLGVANPPLVANSILRPVLYPDTSYWLVVSAPASDTMAGWNWSSPPIYGTFGQREDLGPWVINPNGVLGAFRITGSISIEEISLFIDMLVEDGALAGNGPKKSAGGRLNALINILEEAQRLTEAGLLEKACDKLWDAYRKCDGEPRPPDFVTGEAVEDLADMILVMMDELGCD